MNDRIPLDKRGPGVYAHAPRDQRLNFVMRYGRILDLSHPDVVEHFRGYAGSIVEPAEVEKIIDRLLSQGSLYA